MDNELMETLINLKIDARVLQTLIDTILDNCRLGYDNESMVIGSDSEILAIIKAFRNDEYINRLTELKSKETKLNESTDTLEDPVPVDKEA